MKGGLATQKGLLPWPEEQPALMLAPMQGLTNRAIRALFVEWVRPDLLFTEFMRVSAVARKRLGPRDIREVAAEEGGVPLVVQLFGHSAEALASAASTARQAGARHINLNLGCPYGRMTSGPAGGRLLEHPERLAEILAALRGAAPGTFSLKLRSGYREPRQVLELLPMIEAAQVDFLVLHPRTVIQEYRGRADHAVTAEVVRSTSLPVIANGDIFCAAEGWRVLEQTGAAGLMLGRGAISDPLLFERLRGRAPAEPERRERAAMLRRYLAEVVERYRVLFCGEAQVLSKAKGLLPHLDHADFARGLKALKKARTLAAFTERIAELE